jgi:hypothetical protein
MESEFEVVGWNASKWSKRHVLANLQHSVARIRLGSLTGRAESLACETGPHGATATIVVRSLVVDSASPLFSLAGGADYLPDADPAAGSENERQELNRE